MITAKHMKTIRTLYLFADGHAVAWHMKNDRDAGEVHWITIHESIGVYATFDCPDGGGRLIVSGRAAIGMLLASQGVRCKRASVDNGTPNTRKAGLEVSSTAFDFGYGNVYFHSIPSMIGEDFHYQPGFRSTWEDVRNLHRWGDMPVSECIPFKPKLRRVV
jgi:hypothetical protein